MDPVRSHSMEMVALQKSTHIHKQSLYQIFKHVRMKDLAACCRVSRNWRAVAIDPALWHRFRYAILDRCIRFGLNFERRYPIPRYSHFGLEGQIVQMKVENEDRIALLNRLTGEIQSRKTIPQGEGFYVSDHGVLAFGAKEMTFRYNDGTVFELPITYDFRNEYKHQHVAVAGNLIYVLGPYGISEVDILKQTKRIVLACRDFDHQYSSIHLLGRHLAIFRKENGFRGELELWDPATGKIIFKDTGFSLRTAHYDECWHLYLEGLTDIKDINLTKMTARCIQVQHKECKELKNYDGYSKATLHLNGNRLHIHHLPSDTYLCCPFNVDNRIISIKKINVIGLYVICQDIKYDHFESESSIWQIGKDDVLFRVRKMENINEQGYLLNGVFYQMIMRLDFRCELRVIDNMYPPYQPLKSQNKSGCVIA